jgi:hypothetical protein
MIFLYNEHYGRPVGIPCVSNAVIMLGKLILELDIEVTD